MDGKEKWSKFEECSYLFDFLKKNNTNTIIINGERIECSGGNITIRNGVIKVDGKVIEHEQGKYNDIVINGNINTLECDRAVTVHGDCGTISAGGSCKVDGSVYGNLSAGGSVKCSAVSGNVNAGGSVSTVQKIRGK